MVAMEKIDVRTPILSASHFGAEEIIQIQRGLTRGQASDVRQAIQELTSAGVSSERDHLVTGICAHLLAEHQTALSHLAEVKSNPFASYYLAQVQFSLGNYQAAADAYAEAEKNGYDRVECILKQAGCIRRLGDDDRAVEMLKSVAREAATRAEYSYQMGCVNSDRGDTYGALEYFARAVDMDPRHSQALFSLANLNNQLGNDDEAINLYEQMLSKPPFFVGALMNLGLLYEDREQFSPAAFCFRRVLEAEPNNERARLYLKDIESASEMFYDEDAVKRDKQLEQVMQIPITDFELSARSRNCLERAGISNLEDLTKTTEDQLLAGKNFGETSLKEIRSILELHGLAIGQNLHRKPVEPIFRPEDLSPEERALHETLVTDLDLSVRARKCLARLGLTTIGELLSKSSDELLSVRNFGVTSLNEIREKLTERNLRLRGD